jgi:AcrR family transcriptional regulator
MAAIVIAFPFKLSPLTLQSHVSCVNIDFVARNATYHHGDLRAALITAAAAEIERVGHENLSLRELAASLHVSRAAPYRHFADRRTLLAALATEGFDKLAAIYRKQRETGKTPQARLAESGRAYLAFAAERPQLFRLMFSSDLFSAGPPGPALIKAAQSCYEVFEDLVAATLDDPDDRAIKAATIALMSSTYGFALLRMGDRLRPFMVGELTQGDLVDAVLSMKVAALSRPARRTRRKHSRG